MSELIAELFAQLQAIEDKVEAEAAEAAATAARDKELRIIRKREAMEALLTRLSEEENSPNKEMQDSLHAMLAPKQETTQKTNVFRFLTRTIQSSMRQLHKKCDAITIPRDAENRRQLGNTLYATRKVAGLLLLTLSKIDPEGFFFDVMTTLEEKHPQQYCTRPPPTQCAQLKEMLYTLKNL